MSYPESLLPSTLSNVPAAVAIDVDLATINSEKGKQNKMKKGVGLLTYSLLLSHILIPRANA